MYKWNHIEVCCCINLRFSCFLFVQCTYGEIYSSRPTWLIFIHCIFFFKMMYCSSNHNLPGRAWTDLRPTRTGALLFGIISHQYVCTRKTGKKWVFSLPSRKASSLEMISEIPFAEKFLVTTRQGMDWSHIVKIPQFLHKPTFHLCPNLCATTTCATCWSHDLWCHQLGDLTTNCEPVRRALLIYLPKLWSCNNLW